MNKKIFNKQLVKRYNTGRGRYWLPVKNQVNDIIFQHILHNHIYDQPVLDIILNNINENSVVLDVGANIGQMSIEIAKKAKTVYAFEASNFVYKILCENIKEHESHNIIPINRAIYDKSNLRINFQKHDFSVYHSYGSFGLDPYNVFQKGYSTVTLAIDDLDLPKIDVVKIDVQGADLKAMQGMRKLIDRDKPVIIFEYEDILSRNVFQETLESYLRFVEEINYYIVTTYRDNYQINPKT